MRDEKQGISNRETAREEREERVGEEPLDDRRDRHTSHKAGSRSIAQKEFESKYADRSHPASHKVPGAFGDEPAD